MLLSRFELRRFRGVLPILALIFATLVPVIYGAVYLAANWDPYGNMKNLPVAIVNEDRPTKYNGQQVHAGQDFTDNLVAGNTFQWHVTNAADAEDGLREGRYYLTVLVPSDFSSNLISGASNDPRRAQITLHRNDANGFVIGSVTGSAQGKITEAVNQTAVKSYFEAVFSNLHKIRAGMLDAQKGSQQLTDGLKSAAAGSQQLADGTKEVDAATGKLAAGANTLNDKFGQLTSGATQLQSGLGTLSAGSLTLYDGAVQVAGGTQQLADTVVPVLSRAAQVQGQAKQASAQINRNVQTLSGQVSGSTSSVAERLNSAQQALAQVAAISPDVANSKAWKDAQAKVLQAQQTNAAVAQSAADVSSQSSALNALVQDSASSKDLSAAAAKLTALNNGAHQVADGTKQLAGGIDKAQTGAGALATGLATAQGGVGQLSSGLDQLKTGTAKLSTGATSLDTGIDKLYAGSQKLTKGLTDGVKQIPALTDDQADGAATVLSRPADVKSVVENPAKVYGRGLAPLFFSIAMWVFGISGFLVMRPITGRLLASRINPLRLTLSAFIPFGTVAVVGASLMLATVWIALGLDPVHGLATLGLTLLVAVTFSLIAHTLRMALGLPGSAALLVWLILQLASTGGTYPAAVLPPFFRWISPFMPITYSINAYRVAISGGLWSHYWHDVVVLCFIALAALAVDALMVRRRQRFTMTDLHPPLQH